MLTSTIGQMPDSVGTWSVIQVGWRRFINGVRLRTIRQIELLQVKFLVVQNSADQLSM